MALAHDICIRGDGIVAHALALLLARAPLRVALARSAPAPVGQASGQRPDVDVRAYSLNAASRALLESVRCWPDEHHATPIAHMEVWGDDGASVRFDAHTHGADALAWMVDVPVLQAQLAQAVRFQPQIEVVSAPVQAALTVVCEGRASRTRDELGVAFDVMPYAQHAIATRLRCEKPHNQTAWQWFAGDEILAFLPLQGRQGNWVAVVWSVPSERASQACDTRPEAFALQLESLSQYKLGHLTVEGARACWPLQLARARRWVGPGWALAGDAAHTVHPLSGQGLNLGLADAAELARTLHSRESWRSPGDERLLRRYARARQADVQATSLATDGLQRLFAWPGTPAKSLRNWGLAGFDALGPLKHWVAQRAMHRP